MKRISLGAAVLGLAILAACGGGGGTSSSPNIVPPPGATATPAPVGSAFTSSDAVAIPTPAPGATTVPVSLSSDSTGASANAALPAAATIPQDTTVASTFSTTLDTGVPALSVSRQATSKNVREDNAGRGIAYLRMIFSVDVTMPQAPAFTFTVPGTLPTNVSYWLAFYDPLRSAAGWQKGFEGPATVTPATVNGHTATLLAFASNGKPLSFTANTPYYFAVYAVSPTIATPTPVPTSVPTNAPPTTGKPAPVLSTPANIYFPTTSSSPVPVTFVEQGFTGAFTLHGDCTGVVNTSGASPTWTITPVGQGRCVIVALGDRGATAVVHIGVVTPYETPRPSATPRPSTSPEPTEPPHASPSPGATEPPHASPSPGATEPPHATPTPGPNQTEPPHPSATPRPSATPTPISTATEPPHPSTTPTPRPSVTPSPTPSHSPEPGSSVTPTPTPNPNTSVSPTPSASPSPTIGTTSKRK